MDFGFVQNDLRSLIADLDSILPKIGPYPQPCDLDLTRQILARVRHYLISLEQQSITPPAAPLTEQIAPIERQLTDSITRSKAELESLQQYKQALHREIQQLEQQRQQSISAFSEQRLIHFEATLRTVFERLEKDLQGYYDSLSQGLARMHSLGQQGEAKFLAYHNRLAQQLEQSLSTTQTNPKSNGDELAAIMIEVEQSNTVSLALNPTEASETVETIHSLTDLLEPESRNQEDFNLQEWYLGIDFDPVEFSAVLFSAKEGQTYPINGASVDPKAEATSSFRLPTSVYGNQLNEALSILATQIHLYTENSSPHPVRAGLPRPYPSALRPLSSALPLAGVILSCPAFAPDTYRVPFQAAVLEARLVKEAGQIFWLETAIAALLAKLAIHSELCTAPTTTLVIHAGLTTTELALVNLPENLQSLTHEDFYLCSFAYGGNDLDQDILCQLLYPQWVSQLHPSLLDLLGEFPQPGQPNPQQRHEVNLRLQHHPIGQSLLKAAQLVKLLLQEEEEFTSVLGNQPWSVKRQGLETQVIQPLLQQWEQQIDSLLAQVGKTDAAIEQVICSGKTILALERSLLPWLTQKFPNATFVPNREEDIADSVAAGLAHLPLFPNFN